MSTHPISTHATKSGAFRRLMIAQDVGSAIMGPERGDIYFGSGDEAGRLAGATKQQGHFFVLLPELGSTRTRDRERTVKRPQGKAAVKSRQTRMMRFGGRPRRRSSH